MLLCAPLDWQYAQLPSSASDAVLCFVRCGSSNQIEKKMKKISEYSAPRGTSASWKFAFISRGLRIGRIFAYGRISTLNNSIKKKRKISKNRFTYYLVFFYEYLWKISTPCPIKRNPLLIAILRFEFQKDR